MPMPFNSTRDTLQMNMSSNASIINKEMKNGKKPSNRKKGIILIIILLLILAGIIAAFAIAHRMNQKSLVLKKTNTESNISTLPLEMFMTVTDYDDETKTLTVKISNQSGYTMCYGNDIALQRLENGEYVDVEPSKELAWDEMAYELDDLQEAEVTVDLSAFPLRSGTYRLLKSEMTAEFTLIAK